MRIPVFRLLGAALAAAIAALGLACSGGSGAPSEPPGTIVLFAAKTVDADFNQAALTWLVEPGADSLNLEARLDTTDWATLNTSAIPPDTAGVTLFFDDTAPERMTITFRLTSLVKGKVFMQRTATFRRTLKPALNLGIAVDQEWGGVALSWSRAADTVATGFAVETSADGKTWTAVPGAPVRDAAGTYHLDHPGAGEGQDLQIRVVPTAETERGMPLTGTAHLPPLPPDSLAVTTEGSGLRLAWTNRSQGATVIEVRRTTWNRNGLWTPEATVAILKATDTTYLDSAPPVADRVAYRIAAQRGPELEALSPWAVAGAPTTLAGGTIRRTPLALPFLPLLRDAQGGWVGYRTRWASDPYQTRILRQPQAAGFPLQLTHLRGARDYPTVTFTAATRGPGRLDLALGETTGSFGTCDVRVLHLADGTWSAPLAQAFDGRALGLTTFLGDGSLAGYLLDRSCSARSSPSRRPGPWPRALRPTPGRASSGWGTRRRGCSRPW